MTLGKIRDLLISAAIVLAAIGVIVGLGLCAEHAGRIHDCEAGGRSYEYCVENNAG